MWFSVLSGMAVGYAAPPNIVYILADDLGYGDVHCLNPERCKIATPQIDQLAAQGVTFTDAHSGSAVCTPTRYGILTGRYGWRTRLQRGVLFGYDAPLIAKDRLTVAGYLRDQGYATACIGKWHLGLDLPTTDGQTPKKNGSNVDWSKPLADTPVHHGFDWFYGISGSLDMHPYIYIENDRFVGECTVEKNLYHNRKGPAHADFEGVDVLPTIGKKACEYIARQKAGKPFFAYVALTSPHTPILPSNDWKGKSDLGVYGDFVMQTDAVVGQIVDAVDAAGLAENTMIILTSDNGCSAKPAGAAALQKQGHYPSAQFRGYKSDLWDGGHRVPFIVRWPARVEAGGKSGQTICLTDLMATGADVLGKELPKAAGGDSVSFLPALTGRPIESSRSGIVHHSIDGHFACRQGKWKLLLARASGGWSVPNEKKAPAGCPETQLYDLEADPGETNNLIASHPEVAERLLRQLESDIQRGRSTAGPDLENDVSSIRLRKSEPRSESK
jgi:arylsulfatase A-like enzyme